MPDKLYIIIPAYNEEANIESVSREWHAVLQAYGGPGSRLVIIDDGSKDSTLLRLNSLKNDLPALLPLTKPNSGHGATLLYGYNFAIENNADYIFQTDSDGQTLPSEFGQFWAERETYSALIGFRNKRQDGVSRLFVTKTLKSLIYLIFRVNVKDANTPYRLIQGKTMKKYVPLIPEDFNLTNVLLSVFLVKGKENVKFIPITFRPRQGGKNSINMMKIMKIGIKAIKDFGAISKSLQEKSGAVQPQRLESIK